MTTYAVESHRYTGQLLYTFNAEGVLRGFSAEHAQIDNDTLAAIIRWLPLTLADLTAMVEKAKMNQTPTIKKFYEVKSDISFEAFWAEYPRKVAKIDALRVYARLKIPDQTAAISYIAAYKRQVARDGVAYLYPTSYLNSRRWED